MNDKIQIINDFGERVEAQSPVIISASRSTDIPAFYANSNKETVLRNWESLICGIDRFDGNSLI